MRYSKKFNLPIITYCEDSYIKGNGIVNEGYASSMTGLHGISNSAEEIVIGRNLLLAKEEDINLHITKVSTKTSIELIRIAKEIGIKVTCDTTPHHLSLTDEKILDYNTTYKVSPPLRTKEGF